MHVKGAYLAMLGFNRMIYHYLKDSSSQDYSRDQSIRCRDQRIKCRVFFNLDHFVG